MEKKFIPSYLNKKNSSILFLFFAFFCFTGIAFATPKLPAETLDPDCAPNTTDCYVAAISIGDTINSATATRLLFAGASGVLSEDADLTFSTDTLSATKLLSSTSVSTPSLISTAAITMTPASGSNLNINLATTGDFVVNTDDLYVDTSTGFVGIGDATPSALFVVGNGDLFRVSSTGAITSVVDATINTLTIGLGGGSIATSTAVGYQALLDATTGSGYNSALGYQALKSNTVGDMNTAFGYQALMSNTDGHAQIAIGYRALKASIPPTASGSNVAIGYDSMLNATTATGNTAVGTHSLDKLTTGIFNVAVGNNAVRNITTGSGNVGVGYHTLGGAAVTGNQNTAVGQEALYSNTSGTENASYGYASMYLNTTGSYNTALGVNALFRNTSGDFNVAVGRGALTWNSTGTNNVVIGKDGLYDNTTGGNNTVLGYNAGRSGVGGGLVLDNNIIIGYQAADNLTTGAGNNIVIGYDIDLPVAGGDNQMSIGNLIYATGLGATGTTVSTGFVGIGMNNPSVALDVTGDIEYTGTITDTSDSRLKENIQDITEGLEVVRGLQPKSYNMIGTNRTEYGFIAQEVKLIFPDAVSVIDPINQYLGINYIAFIPILADAIKKMDSSVTEIQNMTNLNFIANMRSWLASAANGIDELFSNKVTTNQLCVGKTCVTELELQQLLQNADINQNNIIIPVPETPIGNSDGEDNNTDQGEEGTKDSGTVTDVNQSIEGQE